MHRSNKNNEIQSITYATLQEWKENDLVSIKLWYQEKVELIYLFEKCSNICRFGYGTQSLSIRELLILFSFFNVCRQDSNEARQVLQALHAAFIFDGKPWLPKVLDTIAPKSEHFGSKTSYTREQINTFSWILKRFELLAKSSVVNELKLYEEALDLVMQFCNKTPYKTIELHFDNTCINNFMEEKAKEVIQEIKKTNFQKVFILLFLRESKFRNMSGLEAFMLPLSESKVLVDKIHASSPAIAYAIPLASCLAIIQDLGQCWVYNILNTRLLIHHPEKSSDLCFIFARLNNPDSIINTEFTEKFYQKLMHPAVLNNLRLVHNLFENTAGCSRYELSWEHKMSSVNLLLDKIISQNFTLQIYCLLNAFLSKDMVIEIFRKVLLLTGNLTPLKHFVPTYNPGGKYIVFPLTDSMITKLDDNDLQDLKRAFSKVYGQNDGLFNQLSVTSFTSLLNKLGHDFVKENLFYNQLKTTMRSNLMTLSCQKAFFSFIGSQSLHCYFSKLHQNALDLLTALEKEVFNFILDMLGSDEWITNILSSIGYAEFADISTEANRYVKCYQLLGKVSLCNKDIYDKSLEKLGRQWLIATISMAAALPASLHYLDGELKLSLITRIGSEHLQTIFPTFHSLHYIFGIKSTETQIALLNLLGNAHLAKLAENRDVMQGHETLAQVFRQDCGTIDNLLNILQVDGQYLIQVFYKKPWRFHGDNAKFILFLEKILPVSETYLADICFLEDLLYRMPASYYSTFIAHLSSINKIPAWEILQTIHCQNKVVLYLALPDSLFITNPMTMTAIKNLDRNVYCICLKKMAIDSLKNIVNNPDFVLSIPLRDETNVFKLLLEKLGANYLKSLSAKPALYEKICKYLPSLTIQPVSDNDMQNPLANIASNSLGRSRDILFANQELYQPPTDNAPSLKW